MNIELSWLDYQKDVFFNFPDEVKYKAIPKGRRAGITRGGVNTFIKKLVTKQGPLLWGDTINGNIQRYFERYFKPVLDENNIRHRWDQINKKLEIGNQFADFRSEDNPENWEGFGYKYIFLNEAGIILKNRSLYINSVLPMLLDYPDSKLVAAGVPKGKMLKDGTEHPFWTLTQRALTNHPKYFTKTFTSYDNPLLSKQDIEDLEEEIAIFSPEQIRQEIYGEFLDTDAENIFATQFDKHHESLTAIFRPEKQLYISVDFNLNPFAVTFHHLWQDEKGLWLTTFDEAEIQNGSIPAMIALIKLRYEAQLPSCFLTGDSTGDAGQLSQGDHASFFEQLRRGLNLRQSQVVIVTNAKHIDSRGDCNYILYHSKPDTYSFFHVLINPEKCKGLIRDLKTVQCDAYGKLIKKDRKDVNQRCDELDTWRGMVNTFLKKYIINHQKRKS